MALTRGRNFSRLRHPARVINTTNVSQGLASHLRQQTSSSADSSILSPFFMFSFPTCFLGSLTNSRCRRVRRAHTEAHVKKKS